MLSHGHDLGNDRPLGPVHTKHFRELSQVLSGSLTDGEDCISQPSHAQIAQLLIKEFDAELAGEQRNVFDNCKADSPLFVLGQLYDSREERLRQEVDPNDLKQLACGGLRPSILRCLPYLC